MSRGLRAAADDWSTKAGRTLDDTAAATSATESAESQAPQAKTPAPRPSSERMVSQTLSLPASDYDRLHAEVRAYARELGLHPRDFNAQAVLRVLVRRLLEDDRSTSDLWRETFEQAKRDADAAKRSRQRS